MQTLLKLARRPLFWRALAVVVVACVAYVVWTREPRYEGRGLSYWLDQLLPAAPATLPSPITTRGIVYGGAPFWVFNVEEFDLKETAAKAVTTLGSRCLPTLLERLGTRATRASGWKEDLLAWAVKRRVVRRPYVLLSNPPGAWAAEVERGQAVTAFLILGETAGPVLSHVLALAKTDPDPRVRAYALEVVRLLSPADYAQVTAQTNVVSAAATSTIRQ
jgi:hypothetical protein